MTMPWQCQHCHHVEADHEDGMPRCPKCGRFTWRRGSWMRQPAAEVRDALDTLARVGVPMRRRGECAR